MNLSRLNQQLLLRFKIWARHSFVLSGAVCVVTMHVSVLPVTSSGRGWVAVTSQSVGHCRVLLGATQCLRLAVVESRGVALVVGRLCARLGLAATAPRRVHVLPSRTQDCTLSSLSPCLAL